MNVVIPVLRTLSEVLTAAVAMAAFSVMLFSLQFLRRRQKLAIALVPVLQRGCIGNDSRRPSNEDGMADGSLDRFCHSARGLSLVFDGTAGNDRQENRQRRCYFCCFERLCRGDLISPAEARSLIPDRQEFAVAYRFLRSNKGFRYSFDALMYRLDSNIGYGKLRVILECMNELGLIQIFEGMYDFEIKMCEVGGKVDLNTSVIIKKLREVSAAE